MYGRREKEGNKQYHFRAQKLKMLMKIVLLFVTNYLYDGWTFSFYFRWSLQKRRPINLHNLVPRGNKNTRWFAKLITILVTTK